MNQANTTNKKLLFVYNANAGFINGMMDLVQKTAKPETYPCKLCLVTFSGATMKKIWKQYIADIGMPTTFLHRDEFAKLYPNISIEFPAVLIEEDKTLSILVSRHEFETINYLPELMNVLTLKLHSQRLA